MKWFIEVFGHETVGEAADNLAAWLGRGSWLDSEKPEQARDEVLQVVGASQAECVQLRRIVRNFFRIESSKYK